MSRLKSKRYLLSDHKAHAKSRDIEFFFTYEEWLAWWVEQLGPEWKSLRGRKRGQYVMARFGDKGPYLKDNVKCITHGQNVKDAANKGGKGVGHKLNAQQVKLIFASKETQRVLAVKYGVSERLIRLIKNKQVWLTVLQSLQSDNIGIT